MFVSNITTPPPVTTPTTTVLPTTVRDCKDWYGNGARTDEIYPVNPDGKGSFNVFCDMTTDGGGWTVFQRRNNDDLSFYDKNWTDYKVGFNNGLENNLWLGNDHIHALTYRDFNVELRIELWGDRSTGPYSTNNPNGYWWEKRTNFFIDDEAHFYTLHSSQDYTGNATNTRGYGIFYSIGKRFTTNDVPNDVPPTCVPSQQLGGWWMESKPSCSNAALNGKYVPQSFDLDRTGFYWDPATYYKINPRRSRMMLRSLVR
uniref:Fibrinogen C-terminal domain-containing protein n=1 Tax=Plectus sambesii TaxID=2011161 RepID=A0A914WHU5_9BILA